jgi:hypothetical protein
VKEQRKEVNPQLKLHNKESNMTKRDWKESNRNTKRIVSEVRVPEAWTEGTTEVGVDQFMQDRGLLDSLDLRLLQDQICTDDGDDLLYDDEVNESGMHTLTEEEFLLECQQDRHYPELGEQVYN